MLIKITNNCSSAQMRLLLLPLLSCLFWIIGCGEPEPDISSPQTHTSGSITFNYPKNWNITQDSVMPGIQNLFIETPGDALVILQVYSLRELDDLATFSKSFSDSASQEIPVGEMSNSTFKDMPNEGGYERIVEDFEISILGESIPSRRLYMSKEVAGGKALMILQVATEDFTKVKVGFDLISNSLQGNQIQELVK